MKINNIKLKKLVNVFNYSLLFLLLTSVLMHLNIIDFNLPFDEYYLLILVLIGLVYTAIRGWQYFEIDTLGEGLTIKVNRIDIFSFLSDKEKKIDIPKYKLNDYVINRGLFNDDLVLLINSRKSKSNVVKVKLRLSVYSNETRNEIVSELDKIVASNQFQLESKLA